MGYSANYSHNGYTFWDEDGYRHLFACAVCYAEVVKDDSIMRVVGQDCAYPMWLLKYKLHEPPPKIPYFPPSQLYQVLPRPKMPVRRRKRNSRPGPDFFFEVRRGQWVRVPAVSP